MHFVVLASFLLVALSIEPWSQTHTIAPRSGRLTVVASVPSALEIAGPLDRVVVLFDRVVDLASIDSASFRVTGEQSGTLSGSFQLTQRGRRVIFQPARSFIAGEVVWVHLSSALLGLDGHALRPGGYAFQFRIAVQPSTSTFTLAATLENDNTPQQTRLLTLLPADLDGDLLPDLVTLNPGTLDIRSFLNQSGGSVSFDSARTTGTPGDEPWHVELADVNRDGSPDALVADAGTSELHVLLGSHDGFFSEVQTLFPVGRIALLDTDGDADLDLASPGAGGIRLWLNDGSGQFVSGALIPSALAPEHLEAGDMNGDGFTDLVISAFASSQAGDQVRTLLADGHGGFAPAGLVGHLTGGKVMALSLGDVDGDGDLDVCAANALYETLGLLRNLGAGVFMQVSLLDFGSSPLSSSLGDLDGDGDLDWLVSNSENGTGDEAWRAYRNDGSGTFAQLFDITAPLRATAACLLDADADGDLDLALADWESEQVFVHTNQ